MKKIITIPILFCALAFSSCKENEIPLCSTLAVVRDYSELDGCGYVFELEDGTILEPRLFPVLFCGTPPVPKEITNHPLYDFEWVDGKQVYIDFEPVNDVASVCMTGQVVEITCLREAVVRTTE